MCLKSQSENKWPFWHLLSAQLIRQINSVQILSHESAYFCICLEAIGAEGLHEWPKCIRREDKPSHHNVIIIMFFCHNGTFGRLARQHLIHCVTLNSSRYFGSNVVCWDFAIGWNWNVFGYQSVQDGLWSNHDLFKCIMFEKIFLKIPRDMFLHFLVHVSSVESYLYDI